MRAQAGEYGQDGTDLVALFARAHQQAMDAEALSERERAQREGIEREANALAAVVAELLDPQRGRSPSEVATELPDDARRRVNAYRHQLSGLRIMARDSLGRPLPQVPPRASVLRTEVRVIDVE